MSQEGRILRVLYDYAVLIIILEVGLAIWLNVFQLAVEDYLGSMVWCRRGVWIGNASTEFLGFTVQYQMEGYGDYSFFYVHWGHNMLRGVMPYSPEFGQLRMDGILNENGIYIFPPLYAVLYAIGIMLPGDDIGIGALLAGFGYMTVFPVYGLAKELSGGNRHVGEAAALTYLLNPNVLYHICFCWLNPSPFIFFFFSGFYALTRGKRQTGTLLIVTAALFKQTAWFLGIPLVIYLFLKPRLPKSPTSDALKNSTQTPESPIMAEEQPRAATVVITKDSRIRRSTKALSDSLDIRGMLSSVIVVVLYVGVIVFPFLLAQPNMLFYMSLASGGFHLDSTTEPPGYPSPMRLQVLPVIAGWPDLAQLLDFLVYYDFLLLFGVLLCGGFMVLQSKDMDHRRHYFRRLLFITMIMMLWVHLAGPRGVYKYYFTLFAPFFSVFSSVKMVTSTEEKVSFSFSMLWVPIVVTLLYLLPSRNVYFLAVIFIMAGYLLASYIGVFWSLLTAPGRLVMRTGRRRWTKWQTSWWIGSTSASGMLSKVRIVRGVKLLPGVNCDESGTH